MFIFNRSIFAPLAALAVSALFVVLDALFGGDLGPISLSAVSSISADSSAALAASASEPPPIRQLSFRISSSASLEPDP